MHDSLNPPLIFLADAMLGSLARKLRIFGFDTTYLPHVSDSSLLKTGMEQSRIILTCDKELFKRILKLGARGVLLSCCGDFKDLVHTLSKLGINSMRFDSIKSRCAMCNSELILSNPSEVQGKVPDELLKRYDKFFMCSGCRKIYWEGSHYKHMRDMARRLELELGNNNFNLA